MMLLLVVGAATTAATGPRADVTRADRLRAADPAFVPNGAQLKVVSSGFEEPVADLLWVRAVLEFGAWTAGEASPFTAEWLRKTVLAITELDPTWRTPYFYGGVTLRVLEDIEGSTLVFERGAEALPDDAFFPFSAGMNAYLHEKDHERAAQWLEKAAACPNAPAWYAAAAAAMHAEGGSLAVAIRYLQDVLASTSDPNVRGATETKLNRLRHDQLVEAWTPTLRTLRIETGHRIERPEDLRSLGIELPPNPVGDAWIVGSDGIVRSQQMEGFRLRELRTAEFRLMR